MVNVVLCTIFADSFAEMSKAIEGGAKPADVAAEALDKHWRAIFNGNGYSDEWPIEAASRGLLNLKNTPEALATWASAKNQALFEKHGVFTAEETEARSE